MSDIFSLIPGDIPGNVKKVLDSIPVIRDTVKISSKRTGANLKGFDCGYIFYATTIKIDGIIFKDTIDKNKNLISIDKVRKDMGAALDGSFFLRIRSKEWNC